MHARNHLAIVVIGLSLLPVVTLAYAGEAEEEEQEKEVDTQFIFGFTMGADVGELGERELEHQTTAQLGKRDGAYSAFTDQLRFEATPAPNFRFEIGAPIAYYNISGVRGLDDRNQGVFNGIQTEFRYRLLDREHAPFGLTLGAEPHWNRTDETSGEPVANYGGELSIAIDKELVKERVFAAVNLVYDPEVSLMPTGLSERDSTLALATSVTTPRFCRAHSLGRKRVTSASMTALVLIRWPAKVFSWGRRPSCGYRSHLQFPEPGVFRWLDMHTTCPDRATSQRLPATRPCFASSITFEFRR